MEIKDLLSEWRIDITPLGADYHQYEDYFRGEEATYIRRMAELDNIIQWVSTTRQDIGSWLDIASGRGTFLEVLERQKIECYGIELDPGLAKESTVRGHSVFHGDALVVLDAMIQRNIHFDMVSCLHLIEHMNGDIAERLVANIAKVLTPGGMAIIVTPNAKDFRVMLGSFYRDPTHIRPYPKELLAYLCNKSGLEAIYTKDFDRFLDEDSSLTGDGIAKRIENKLKRVRDMLKDEA